MECIAVAEFHRAKIVMTEQTTMVCEKTNPIIDASFVGTSNQGLPQSLHLENRKRTLLLVGSVIFRSGMIQAAVVKERTLFLE